jgi:hypothetical protein
MCLHIIKDEKPPESGIGYKIFFQYPEGYHFQFKYLNGITHVPIDRWIWAEKGNLMDENGVPYESGFHIYKNISSPEWILKYPAASSSAVIVKVQYKGARILGLEFEDEVIVADQIYVPGPWQSTYIGEQL